MDVVAVTMVGATAGWFFKWLIVKALVTKAKPEDVPRIAEAAFKKTSRGDVRRSSGAGQEVDRK
ncbi:hypothetical protein L3Q67_25745 [Saccharothrix sp. AJ9571]|nr:hypothetical protein L3Q67_25745 [Saccharothrix sp. AJ9571]